MKRIKFLLCLMLTFTANIAFADDGNLANFFNISGDLRSYYFNKGYAHAPSESTYAFGGALNIETVPIYNYFQAETTFYTAQPLGLNSSNPKLYDRTLPGNSVNALGQAYLQFKNDHVLVKAGDELIDTPWLGPSDSRMIPATYQGFYATYAPVKDIMFTALRVFGFKSRTDSGFTATNLYNTNAVGGIPLAGLGTTTNNGALALGGDYKNNDLNSQVWFYQFYDFAKLFYNDNTYTYHTSTILNPVVGLQVLRETADGNNYIARATGLSPDASAFGALVGIENDKIYITAAYNKVVNENGAFSHGDIVSPYTAGYATDPLYTTQMLAGLIEKSSGNAIKLSATYYAFNQQLSATASYAKYYTEPQVPDSSEANLDVTYKFAGMLKKLSIRNRLGILTGNLTTGRQINNRLMMQYNF